MGQKKKTKIEQCEVCAEHGENADACDVINREIEGVVVTIPVCADHSPSNEIADELAADSPAPETYEERKERKAKERARQEACVIALGAIGVFSECMRGGTRRVVLKVEDAEALIALIPTASERCNMICGTGDCKGECA